MSADTDANYRQYTGVLVPAAGAAWQDGLDRRSKQRARNCRGKRRAPIQPSSSTLCISASLLSETNCDPGGVLENLGVLSATDFWRWFHAPDGPEGGSDSHMGQKWGELWHEFLQTDSLVLAGAVPLVLQKRAQMTGASEDKRIRVAELRALQQLRQRLETLELESVGGLIVAICGRVQVNVQESEYDFAMMHLQAIRQLVDMQPPPGAVWMCSAWTDLRVVSSTGAAPMLQRYIPDSWRARSPALLPQSVQACQRAAMSNMRALGHTGTEHFLRVYGIFRNLHELEMAAAAPGNEVEPPIETLYFAVHDSCSFDAELAPSLSDEPLIVQIALLAICLKLCVWEKASRYVPRGGEIERNLLRKAKHLLGDDSSAVKSVSKFTSGANTNAMLWMLFTLTATAYMFQRDELDGWIERLRAVSSVSTASAFQRPLKGWPCASWWFSHALRRICNELAPKKGQWRVLTDEPDPVPVFTTGLRLKLLVIAG